MQNDILNQALYCQLVLQPTFEIHVIINLESTTFFQYYQY